MRISGWLYVGQQSFAAMALLLAAARITRARVPAARAAAASLLCGICSLLPAMTGRAWLQLPGMLAACMLCATAAPGLPARQRMQVMRAAALLFTAAAGIARLAASLGLPRMLVPLPAAALLLLRPPDPASCPASIRADLRLGGHRVTLDALADTGNLLRDPLTGLPVIVCARKAVAPLCPAALTETYPPGLRLISVRTVAGSALMPVLRPDSLRIRQGRTWQEARAVVGLAPMNYQGCQCIMPASLTRPVPTRYTQGGAL